MKILVTGATGLLGRPVYNLLKNTPQWDVTGTAYSRAKEELIKLDLLNSKDVYTLMNKIQPQLIIHCAAERRPDVCKNDPVKAEKINVESVATISKAASEIGAAVLYISTDYVFDGTAPPYSVDAEPNPLNFYGKMKLAGEKNLLSSSVQSIILRVPILYGKVEDLAESAITQIAEKLLKSEVSSHDNQAIRYPTHTDDVAIIIKEMIKHLVTENNFSGVFHWSGDEPFTKYQMAIIMGEYLGIKKENILEAQLDPDAAPRPLNAHLDNTKLKALGIAKEIPFKAAIEKILFPHK